IDKVPGHGIWRVFAISDAMIKSHPRAIHGGIGIRYAASASEQDGMSRRFSVPGLLRSRPANYRLC
ncbi:MAG: hypothetical protein ABW192_08315, partial [Sphingobium sp.]